MKRLKRMFGISAPQMAVRAAIPWYLRWLGLLAFGVLVLFLGHAVYDFGKQFAGFDQSQADGELKRLTEAHAKVLQELAALRAELAKSERQLQMERATYGDLAKQMKALNDENGSLKEDLVFFQTLMPSGGKEGGVAVNRFVVQNDALPGEYRYRLLLTQTGQRTNDFTGNVQLFVNLQQDNKKVVMLVPADNEAGDKAYKLNFRFYQRVEGTFHVGAGAVVKSVQVRIFESGSKEPRLTQAVNAS